MSEEQSQNEADQAAAQSNPASNGQGSTSASSLCCEPS
jgi:hypothetical protein